MTFSLNLIVIAIILIIAVLAIYFIFKKDLSVDDEKNNLENYNLDYLTNGIKESITAIQNTNVSELNLNKVETKKREELKAKLDRAVRYCCTGDTGQKEYLKEYIAELLLKKYNINESTINYVMPFEKPEALSVMDKFDILLFLYQKEKRGYISLNDEYHLDRPKKSEDGFYYSVENDDIELAYQDGIHRLSFVEKLDIITQRIYQRYAGHGIVDSLREDKSIDGVSGGVSGSTNLTYEFMEEIISETSERHNRYDSIWIFVRGKPVRMKFMSFGTQRELERVVHNLYRNGNPGWLSSLRGYIVNDSKDGNRITCVRPPFSESFAFFVRKFDSISLRDIYQLITHEGNDIPITILKYLVKGYMVMVITGEQNSGKSTLLKSLVNDIDKRSPIRTLESFYELWLSKLYPEKNITGFRVTDTINVAEAISVLKKTDATVMIAGESADFITAAVVVELSLVGTKMTISTNHAMTSEALIEYHTNAVMSKDIALYSEDVRAEHSVAKALNFDIHMVKTKTGERYIERITEIVPLDLEEDTDWPEDINECMKLYFKKMTRRKMYKTVDIVVFGNGHYVMKNKISDRALAKMYTNLEDTEIKEFNCFMDMHMRG